MRSVLLSKICVFCLKQTTQKPRTEFVLSFCHLSDLARIKISVLFNNSTEAHSTAEHLALRTGIVGFRTACTFLTGPPRGSHCKRYREIETDNFPLMWELSAVPRVCNYRRPGSVFLVSNIVGLLFTWCVSVLLMELSWKSEDSWIFNL